MMKHIFFEKKMSTAPAVSKQHCQGQSQMSIYFGTRRREGLPTAKWTMTSKEVAEYKPIIQSWIFWWNDLTYLTS